MSNINQKVIDRLKTNYHMKQSGEWLQKGICPNCSKKSLWTHATNPRIVKCNRLNKCGLETHVKDLFDDLFKDWSKSYNPTPTNPTATADAYLTEGRGLSLVKIKGFYSQETYYDKQQNISSATVRFPLPNDGWWERLIDQADRFKAKANIKMGYKVGWLVEGIFDACALAEHGLDTASPISCSNFPQHSLAELKSHYYKEKQPLPTLIFAYDNDHAGKRYTKKHIKLAEEMGFTCKATLKNIAIMATY